MRFVEIALNLYFLERKIIMSNSNPENSQSILDKVKPLLEKVKPVLEKLKPIWEKIKELAIKIKDFAINLWNTKRPVAIGAIAAFVAVTTLVVVLLVGGSGTGKGNSGGKDGYPDSAKDVGVAFMEACVDQDGTTACSYMPDFMFKGKKDEIVTQFTDRLKYFIKTYYTNLGMELSSKHRQTYINLDNEEKSEILQKLTKYQGFDKNKVQDYAYCSMYLLISSNGGDPIDEYQQITLIKYDGKWVVVDYTWPEIK